jgi:uncharacterized membrane protein
MIQEAPDTATEIHSRATIAGHPIHPMLISFPIAFLTGTLLADLIYLLTRDVFWAQAAFWLIVAGVISGLFAAVFGIVDFVMNSRIRALRMAWLHGGGNVIMIFLAVVNLLVRSDDPVAGVLPWGILLSIITVILLIFTGWYGGELVFRHGVGVNTND